MTRAKSSPAERDPRHAAAYRLMVVLRGSKPRIWRRVLVDTQATLAELHDALQVAMGWNNAHLHCFRIGRHTYEAPSPDNPRPVADERDAILVQIAPKPGTSFVYEYDFGDSWEHDLTVEEVLRDVERASLPACLAGARACPPEDSGGVPGYQRMLAILAHPHHRDHNEVADWLGAFDPKAFDLVAVNERLARLRRR